MLSTIASMFLLCLGCAFVALIWGACDQAEDPYSAQAYDPTIERFD